MVFALMKRVVLKIWAMGGNSIFSFGTLKKEGDFFCLIKNILKVVVSNISTIVRRLESAWFWISKLGIQGIPIVTLYSYLSILVGKISTVFLQNLEYLLIDVMNITNSDI